MSFTSLMHGIGNPSLEMRRDLPFALLLFIGTLGLYLSTHSVSYFVDGLNFAKAVEEGDVHSLYFFHPHHLLYSPIGFLLHRVGGFFGHSGRAVAALQFLSSIMGALGVSFFFLLMRRLGSGRAVAMVGSLFLAFSYGYWYHSVNVKSTVPALALLMGSLGLLTSAERGSLKSLLCGILHGGAILLHAVHVLWVLPAGVFLGISRERRNLVSYLVGLISSVAVPYLIVAISVARLESAGQVSHWATLYLHSQPSYWDASLSSVWLAMRNVGVSLFGGHYFFPRSRLFWPFVCILLTISIFLLYSLVRLIRGWRGFCGKCCYVLFALSLTYGAIHLFWCPGDYSFWVIQLIPLSVWVFLAWKGVTHKSVMLLLAVIGMHFGLNLLGNIIPKHLSPAPYVEVIHRMRERSAEDDLFIILGLIRTEDGYVEHINPNVPYFLGREYVTLPQIGENREEEIERIQNRVKEGSRVYLWWDFTPYEIDRLHAPYLEVGREVISLYPTEPCCCEGEYLIQVFVPE